MTDQSARHDPASTPGPHPRLGASATHAADPAAELAAEHASLSTRARALISAERPNRLRPVLAALASDVPWPAALDETSLLALRDTTVRFAEYAQRIAAKEDALIQAPLRTLGWHLDCGERARTVLAAAGMSTLGTDAPGTTARVLLEALTAVLTRWTAWGLTHDAVHFDGDPGHVAFQRAVGAARWVALAAAGPVVLVGDLKTVLEAALPPGWAQPGMDMAIEAWVVTTSRERPDGVRDVINVAFEHDEPRITLTRRGADSYTLATAALTVAELCLLAADDHRLVSTITRTAREGR